MQSRRSQQRTLAFERGDTLLLYTDGLTEAFSPDGELFGEMRLMDVMNSLQANSADDVLQAVEECLNDFVEANPLADDLTMLAIRKHDSPQV
ncbi:MAG: SpoIIE family protein phosphatase [Chloroflexi bacterium]|nr:SpoIIE family protein phosphatase [Chloroflexota bacterium]